MKALVVVMNSDREHLLGVVLPDDVVVENLADFLRRWNAVTRFTQRGLLLLLNDVLAQLDAFIADEHRPAGDELAHLLLARRPKFQCGERSMLFGASGSSRT
jgi:hypothetical protein